MSELPHAGSVGPRVESRAGAWAAVAFSVVASFALVRFVVRSDPGATQTFALAFASIAIEALPFVLLGAVISAALARWVPRHAFAWVGRLPLPLQIPAASLAGVALPVCECGSVPVARQLIARGVHPAAGISFMLAAPVVNPIVLGTTAIAYSGRGAAAMVAGRAALGLVTAMVVGLVARGETAEVLRPRPVDEHDHRHDAHGLVDHVLADFLFMGRFVVLGAALAALFQVLIPQHAFGSVGHADILATLALMALAFALSLCSEADAFVAASFTGFPVGAQLAFLTFGPVADFKLALLYRATFRRATAAKIVGAAAAVVFSGALWFAIAMR
jgi:uncharacterized membrane protein YraQ (UPF0718 family)